jgi:hypothetical protein
VTESLPFERVEKCIFHTQIRSVASASSYLSLQFRCTDESLFRARHQRLATKFKIPRHLTDPRAPSRGYANNYSRLKGWRIIFPGKRLGSSNFQALSATTRTNALTYRNNKEGFNSRSPSFHYRFSAPLHPSFVSHKIHTLYRTFAYPCLPLLHREHQRRLCRRSVIVGAHLIRRVSSRVFASTCPLFLVLLPLD